MAKKKEVIKLIPFSLKEVSTINKLKQAMELPYIVNFISNNRGGFSCVKLKNDKPFEKEIINRIIKEFKKTYEVEITFENAENVGEFYVGNFVKLAN